MNEITKELMEALKPFAAFFDAVEHMGGNYPKTGAIYSVISHIGGHREITVEDFKQARETTAKAEACGTTCHTISSHIILLVFILIKSW